MDDISTGDIGARLRRAREQLGLSLHDVAGRTKLSITVLRAIERNDFESLPHGVYRKGYLRSLAGEVGLDPEEIAADYDKKFASASTVDEVSRQISMEEMSVLELTPSPRRSLVTLVITIALAIGWFAWRDDVEPALPPSTPAADLMQAAPLPDRAPASAAVHRTSAPAERLSTPSPVDTLLRIEMAASGWCWMAAESDGERALYRLVAPGERVVLEGRRLISLRLGNAGSVTLSVNDGPPRLAGADGEIVELSLTPDNVAALRGDVVEKVSGV